MTQRRCTPGGVALIAGALVVALLLMPTASAAKFVPSGGAGAGSCVALQGPPPWGIVVNPECKPVGNGPSTSSQNGLSADANLTGPDVEVSWTLGSPNADIDAYQILRGATPYAMDTIGATQVGDRAFVDTGATWSGEAVWYAVQGVDSAGEAVVASQPVLVEPGV